MSLPFTIDAFLDVFGGFGLVRRRLSFGAVAGLPRWFGIGLPLFALAYPVLSVFTGHMYPASPTFGVPCPTVIFTAGALLMCRRPPLVVALIPILWSLVGGFAAVQFGVAADYVLLACAPLLIAKALSGRRANLIPAKGSSGRPCYKGKGKCG